MIPLPLYLFLFSGVSGGTDPPDIWESILILLLLARLTGSKVLNYNRKIPLNQRLMTFFTKGQLAFLCLAIAAMFASQGDYLLSSPEILYLMIIPILAFFLINYFFS